MKIEKSERERILENYTKENLDCRKLVSLIDRELKTVSYSSLKKLKSTNSRQGAVSANTSLTKSSPVKIR